MSRVTAEALQQGLAAEHAAVWVYGVIGGQTSEADDAQLFELVSNAYRAHRGRRDQLVGAIARAGVEPVASEVGYEVGYVDSESGARVVALEVERRCASAYAQVVAATTGAHRRFAVAALTDAAVRGLGFGGTPEAWPGITPEV